MLGVISIQLKEELIAVENPTLEKAMSLVGDAFSKRKALVIVGRCWVNYQGRASSELDPGERIVIFKGDGSVLVHRPFGYEPVNWQPPRCIFQVSKSTRALQIIALRRKPSESLRIFFDLVYIVAALSLEDKGELSLHVSEKKMHKAVLKQPSLVEDGFKLVSYEKKVDPGFVDLYGVDKRGRFVVVEIKRRTASKEAALQLLRYVEAIRGMTNREVRGVLMAPSLAKGVQRLLETSGLDFKFLDPKKCAKVLSKSENRPLFGF